MIAHETKRRKIETNGLTVFTLSPTLVSAAVEYTKDERGPIFGARSGLELPIDLVKQVLPQAINEPSAFADDPRDETMDAEVGQEAAWGSEAARGAAHAEMVPEPTPKRDLPTDAVQDDPRPQRPKTIGGLCVNVASRAIFVAALVDTAAQGHFYGALSASFLTQALSRKA